MLKTIIDHFVYIDSNRSIIKIIDTDFEDEFEWNYEYNIASFWDGIVGVYERHNAKVAANIVLAIQNRTAMVNIPETRDVLYRASEKLAQYREEIERLMLLV